MAVFKPFPAVRPQASYCSRTLCPPYDIINREEAAEYSKDPASFMRVIRADAALPKEMEYSAECYELSRSILDQMISDGIYFVDEAPQFYIYSETLHGHTQTGIVGCASIDEYENGKIKKHEKTLSAKEQDRIRHFTACDANTEPVFLTYRDDENLLRITHQIMEAEAPVYETVDQGNVTHRLWVVSDPTAVKQIEQMFSDVDALYIADGHHRTASSVHVGQKKREQTPDSTGDEEFNRFMAVVFPESELLVLPYNRLLLDLSGLSTDEFLDKIREVCDVTVSEDDDAPVSERHSFKIYINGVWHVASFRKELIPVNDPVQSLDTALLQDKIFEPFLGIQDPKTDLRLSFSGGFDSARKMKTAVDEGKAAAAILMYPVTVQEIMDVADTGKTMPPKSTWFEPKLGSGWFIHQIG